MKIDPETAETMRKGQVLRDFVDSEGWAEAKSILLEMIRVTDSVSAMHLDGLKPDEIGYQTIYRAGAISLVHDWLAAIEGRLEQHQQNAGMLAELRTDEIFRNYSSSS